MIVWVEGENMNFSLGSSLSFESRLKLREIEKRVRRVETHRSVKRVVRVPVKRELELVHA